MMSHWPVNEFLDYNSVSPTSCCLLLCRHTHELKLHQLLVRVCGWEQVKPVSVDKVGVFFRYAAADRNNSSNTVSTIQNFKNNVHVYSVGAFWQTGSGFDVNPSFFCFTLPQVGSPISRTNIIHPHVYVSLASLVSKSETTEQSLTFSIYNCVYCHSSSSVCTRKWSCMNQKRRNNCL